MVNSVRLHLWSSSHVSSECQKIDTQVLIGWRWNLQPTTNVCTVIYGDIRKISGQLMKLEHDNQPWIGQVVPLLTYSPTFPPMQYGHVAEGTLLPKSYYIYFIFFPKSKNYFFFSPVWRHRLYCSFVLQINAIHLPFIMLIIK